VDYGCGDGKLAAYVQNEKDVHRGGHMVSHKLLKYKKYIRPEGDSDYLRDEDMKSGSFDAMVSCPVFEYLLSRHDVDEIIGFLSDKGTLCMHTLVCEEVPKTPAGSIYWVGTAPCGRTRAWACFLSNTVLWATPIIWRRGCGSSRTVSGLNI